MRPDVAETLCGILPVLYAAQQPVLLQDQIAGPLLLPVLERPQLEWVCQRREEGRRCLWSITSKLLTPFLPSNKHLMSMYLCIYPSILYITTSRYLAALHCSKLQVSKA